MELGARHRSRANNALIEADRWTIRVKFRAARRTLNDDGNIDIVRIGASSLNIQRSLEPASKQKIIYATVKSSRTVS